MRQVNEPELLQLDQRRQQLAQRRRCEVAVCQTQGREPTILCRQGISQGREPIPQIVPAQVETFAVTSLQKSRNMRETVGINGVVGKTEPLDAAEEKTINCARRSRSGGRKG